MKCILLVRVSTESQSYDEQEKELFDLAKSDGYKNEEIVCIAEKESGIKLSEEERKGLSKMKDLIATGEYDCVYAWEVSRIARKKKVLFSIVDFLLKNHIQLIIKEPSLRLLKPDGSIDEGAEVIFTLYSQIAESEMRNKLARFARAKKEGFNAGKYMGGKVTLGYRVNDQGFWEIDPEEAELIRLIFDLYNTGDYSMTELAKELIERGYFKNTSTVTNLKAQLWHLIKNPLYRGERTSNNIYPQIIDDETWEKTVKRRQENRYKTARESQRFLTTLIRCKCGSSYSANLMDCVYCCRVRHNAVEKGLEHSPSINLNMIESLAWYFALSEMQEDLINKRGIAQAEYNKEIAILEQKICTSKETLNSVMQRRNDLDENYYVYQRFSKERYEQLAKKMNDVVDKENANIRNFNAKISAFRKQIQAETTFDDLLDSITNSFDELKEGTDIEIMRKIVRRYIKEITIEEIPNDKSSYFHKKVIFETNYRAEQDIFKEKVNELGIEDLSFINSHSFYVDTRLKKAYYDVEMTNEVPMFYMEREARRRIDYRSKKYRQK